MKKFVIISLALSVALASCKDDGEEPTPGDTNKTKTDMMSEGEWRLDSGSISPSITVDFGGNTIVVNNYWDLLAFAGGGEVKECDKDNLMICKRDSSVELNEGPSKCDPGDPQMEGGGKWFFVENETKINFSSFPQDPTGEPRVMTIENLSSSALKLSMIYKFDDPLTPDTTTTDHNIILNYSNQK